MKKEREEYLSIIRSLDGDAAGKAAAQNYINHSDGRCYGIMAPISFVPALYTADDVAFFKNVCETTHRILCKVIAQYLKDPEYRKLFGFSPEVERLILLPCGYDELLPMSRFDLFLNEDDLSFKFCEFNADGAAAMSRTDLGCEAVMLSESYRRFAARHQVSRFDLFDSWVDEMMKTYRTDRNAVPSPNVLITDFDDAILESDITRFLAAFHRKGISARFMDARKLKFDGTHLYDPSDGMVFHAVYRRLVTSDLAAREDECSALIGAVASEAVSLIGHFRTTVVHSKTINIALLSPRTEEILTPKEWEFVRSHVLPTYKLRTALKGSGISAKNSATSGIRPGEKDPATSDIIQGAKDPFILDVTPGEKDSGTSDIISLVKHQKDRWILKPEDNYDAKGVFAGVDHPQKEWEAIVNSCTDNHYIAMEYFEPPLAETFPLRPLPYTPDPRIPEKWHVLTGAFSYNGHFHGFFSMMGKAGVINENRGGVSVPSFGVDLKNEIER